MFAPSKGMNDEARRISEMRMNWDFSWDITILKAQICSLQMMVIVDCT